MTASRQALILLSTQRGGEIVPKRQKTFSTYLSEALPTSLGTGCSALRFTADSSRFVVATSFGSFIAIIQLPTSRDDDFDVLKVFSQHSERESGRELRGKLATKGHNGDATMNGVKGNGVHHDSDSESNMNDESEEEEQPEIISSASKPALVASMVISTDGRWLASADVERKTCVFDLETLKVSAIDGSGTFSSSAHVRRIYPDSTISRCRHCRRYLSPCHSCRQLSLSRL